jgi:hypothetical protein
VAEVAESAAAAAAAAVAGGVAVIQLGGRMRMTGHAGVFRLKTAQLVTRLSS